MEWKSDTATFDELHMLKPIEELLAEYEYEFYDENGESYFINKIWSIVGEMLPRFGNGVIYKFKSVDGYYYSVTSEDHPYTHFSDDNYLYHESWFVDKPVVILKFDDKEFLI